MKHQLCEGTEWEQVPYSHKEIAQRRADLIKSLPLEAAEARLHEMLEASVAASRGAFQNQETVNLKAALSTHTPTTVQEIDGGLSVHCLHVQNEDGRLVCTAGFGIYVEGREVKAHPPCIEGVRAERQTTGWMDAGAHTVFKPRP